MKESKIASILVGISIPLEDKKADMRAVNRAQIELGEMQCAYNQSRGVYENSTPAAGIHVLFSSFFVSVVTNDRANILTYLPIFVMMCRDDNSILHEVRALQEFYNGPKPRL